MQSKATSAGTSRNLKQHIRLVVPSFSQAALAMVLLWGLSGLWLSAQTFKSVHSFAGTTVGDGASPGYGALVQGLDGNLYGTTTQGGASCSFFGSLGCGEVFKIPTKGPITGIYKFCSMTGCADGNDPYGGLALDTDGSLHGMTDLGGTDGIGAIFLITSAGMFSTQYSFDNSLGSEPLDTLVRASDGNFYGFTQTGGQNGYGAIFDIGATGLPGLVLSFDGTDGTGDATGGLVQGTDGNFYGVSPNGNGSQGTVFEVTPAGAITVLHTFNIPDGIGPTGTLVEDAHGNFYGTTRSGGLNDQGTVFMIRPGTIPPKYKIIYNFCMLSGCADGFDPVAGLIQGTDGKFYGTTLGGGTGSSPGTVFQITSAGVLTTLHSFNGLSDGTEPFAGLVQHTDGVLYGTTNAGGTNGLGTIFSLSVRGLKPFVRTLPGSAKVGDPVIILGSNLMNANAVSFHGTNAVILTDTDTEITTNVPVGATSGFVKVTTANGTVLQSNVTFQVQ